MIHGLILQISTTVVQDTAARVATQLATTTPASPQALSLWELILKGGPVMIPLGILSFAAIYLFIERFLAVHKASKQDSNFMNNIRDFINNQNIDAAKALCKNTDAPIARMLDKGLKRMNKPIKEIEESIENVGKLEIYKIEKNIALLGTIAGIAPMFGFLGTIFGVIKIFYNISLADNISIGLIAGGLYEKMITSAAGLMIGIVAYLCHHYLAVRVDRVVNKIETNAIEFIDLLQETSK